MTSSDLDVLLEMGFDKPRAELAVKKSGGLQGALEWLEKNQDTPLEDLQKQAAASSSSRTKDEDDDAATQAAIQGLTEGELAKSLICNDCGKKFRSHAQAEFHASKTEHENFSESTEEIAPLTEEEKKTRLAELRAKVAEKKSRKTVEDLEDQKRNEKIRQKSTQETQDMKEELQRKEQIKEAAKKRQEKLDDIAAKKRIKDKIEADKKERQRKAEEAKAAREGKPVVKEAVPAAVAPAAPKSSASYSEARLRLQTPGGNVQKSFPADTSLFEVAQALESEGTQVSSFTLTFPRKVFEAVDFGQTLREAGLVPSAVLIVK